MANNILMSSKSLSMLLSKNVSNYFKLPSIICSRHLYAKASLGLDNFVEQRTYVQHQMVNIADQFKQKMVTYSGPDSKNMIFTEDLKNMVHLAETDADIDLVVTMAKKFNQQNKSLRFGNFVFGPVVMRLFHIYNKADLALECFKSPEFVGFFDQLISYTLLLDLLYENGKYKEILELFQIITERQLENAKYPKNVVVLAFAACFKLNTKESLESALKIWKELNEAGHFPMRRAVTFCAGLALNQNQPEIALEISSTAKNTNYTTIRNIKAAALSDLGRVDDAIAILKSIIADDRPDEIPHTFNPDVLGRVKAGVLKSGSEELKFEFDHLEKLFEKQGHISKFTLDQQLCSEIQRPPTFNSNKQQSFNRVKTFRSRDRSDTNTTNVNWRLRPGLKELV